MTKKTRTIVFLICLVVFLIGGPSAILYSQGYRINLGAEEGGKWFTQTGGIFIKASPRQTEIYVDGKLEEKTDFLFGSTLVENLFPGKYEVEVKKEGFQSWKKTLEVKEKEVTESKNILLFPEDITFSTSTENIEMIWTTPDKNLITKTSTSTGWTLTLDKQGEKTELLKESDVSQNKVDLLNLTFSATSSEITLETKILNSKKYFTFDPQKSPLTVTELKTPETSLEYTYNDYIFKKEGKSLYVKSPDSLSFEKLADSVNKISLSPDGRKLLYITSHEISIFFLEDTIVPRKQAGEKMLLLRLSENIKDCQWIKSDYLVFSTEDKITITEIDNRDNLNTIDVISTKNPEIFWNDNEKQLYYLSDNTLFVSVPLLP